MRLTLIKTFLATAFLAGTSSLLSAQSSNTVWFVTWNGQPTPGADVSVRSLAANGSGAAIATGAANYFVSQTNLPALNSPYDLAVDTAIGKVYVLDNNIPGGAPEYIYSFNLTGTPAQIAASKQIIYTLPVPTADVSAGLYPLISGLALDSVNHNLYFNQIDVTTGTNSFIGRLSLSTNSSPVLQTLYVGQVPSQGSIAVDASSLYLGSINATNNNDGIFTASLSGSGNFSEIVTNSVGNATFTNGLVSGVASAAASNLVYYLTFNAGVVNHNYSLSQNAIWAYNTVTHTSTKIGSGYGGSPNNLALDTVNGRYYFTLGRDSTGNASPTNYQAIYTGVIGSTSAPTLFYTPSLSGQDIAGQPNAGNVSVQGIYIQPSPIVYYPPIAGTDSLSAAKNIALNVSVASLLANDSDTNANSPTLSISAVSSTSTNGGSVVLNGSFITYTPTTNFVGRDQFTYTLANSDGQQAQGTVIVNVLSLTAPATNKVALTLLSGSRLFLFTGAANQSYVVQSANAVTGPWLDISPAIPSGAAGIVEYNDLTSPLSVMKFYRVRTGP